MADETKPRPTAPAPRSFGKVAVEVADLKNKNVHFYPLSERLRGRWENNNLGHGSTPSVALQQMPNIPGLHLTVNVNERSCELHDPLNDPTNKSILEKASLAHQSMEGKSLTPRPDVVRDEDVSDDDLATWLYWMMRLVKNRQAVVISGNLPKSEAEIKDAFPKAFIRKDYSDAGRATAS